MPVKTTARYHDMPIRMANMTNNDGLDTWLDSGLLVSCQSCPEISLGEFNSEWTLP